MKIELRDADETDVPALRRNWQACFGDEDEYLDFFFEKRFRTADAPVLTADGGIVSQLFLLPATLRDASGDTWDICYLFAAATHPEYRRRGYMAKLLRFAADEMRAKGKRGIALLPGERSLYAYYETFGFQRAFRRRVWEGNLSELPTDSVPNDPQTDALAFLETYFKNRTGVCWDRQALEFALEEHRLFRGQYAANARAFAAVEDDVCRIVSAPNDLGSGVALLRQMTQTDRVKLILPPDAPLGEADDGGMFLAFRPTDLGEAFLCFAKE